MKTANSLLRGLFDLHSDEDGMEAIQVVALVAIGAIVLVALKGIWTDKVQPYADRKVDDLVK